MSRSWHFCSFLGVANEQSGVRMMPLKDLLVKSHGSGQLPDPSSLAIGVSGISVLSVEPLWVLVKNQQDLFVPTDH
jgi:hypothetical protein